MPFAVLFEQMADFLVKHEMKTTLLELKDAQKNVSQIQGTPKRNGGMFYSWQNCWVTAACSPFRLLREHLIEDKGLFVNEAGHTSLQLQHWLCCQANSL